MNKPVRNITDRRFRRAIVNRFPISSNKNIDHDNNDVQIGPSDKIVTFEKLGNNGRLGNQLFQIAAAIGYSVKHESKINIPVWFCSYTQKNMSDYFKNKINQTDGRIHFDFVYTERFFDYSEIDCKNNLRINLHGYFQSEKYFENCKEEIRFYFTPDEKVLSRIYKKYKKNLLSNTCSVHIRRGDYIDHPIHGVCDLNYYISAMKLIKSKKDIGNFLIFSDDIEWCKANIIGDDIFYVEGNMDIEDLFLMSLCNDHIISNSSFSWWGSWLCNYDDKIIISPRRWFTEKSAMTYNDIHTKEMILI